MGLFTKRQLTGQVDKNSLPRHVAVIMDGNGRWAQKRGLPRSAGSFQHQHHHEENAAPDKERCSLRTQLLLCVNKEAYGKCEGDDKGKHHAGDACPGYHTYCHSHPPCRYTIGVFARPAPGGEQGHSISSSGGRSI